MKTEYWIPAKIVTMMKPSAAAVLTAMNDDLYATKEHKFTNMLEGESVDIYIPCCVQEDDELITRTSTTSSKVINATPQFIMQKYD